MLIAWQIFVAASSFLGASYVWLFAKPLPPEFDRFGLTMSTVLFALVGLYFAYQVCREGLRPTLWLILTVMVTQALVVYHILQSPFFKI
jgi:hypothetical protein